MPCILSPSPRVPSQDEIVGSAYASAVYISSVLKLPKDKKVYVVGMSGIEEELREEGTVPRGFHILAPHTA